MATNHPDLVEMVKDGSPAFDLALTEAQKRNAIAPMTFMWGGVLGVVAMLTPARRWRWCRSARLRRQRWRASPLRSSSVRVAFISSPSRLVDPGLTAAIFMCVLGLNVMSFGALLAVALLAAAYSHAGSLGRSRTPLTAR